MIANPQSDIFEREFNVSIESQENLMDCRDRDSMDFIDLDNASERSSYSNQTPMLLTETFQLGGQNSPGIEGFANNRPSMPRDQIGDFAQDVESQEHESNQFPPWASCWCPVREKLDMDSDEDEMMMDVETLMTVESTTHVSEASEKHMQQKQHQPKSTPNQANEARNFWSQCCGSSRTGGSGITTSTTTKSKN
jgi:hypothetical protein